MSSILIIMLLCFLCFLFLSLILILINKDLKIGKIVIKYSSFKGKKLQRQSNSYGVYFFCGRQGSGKSMYATYFCSQQDHKLYKGITTNMKSLNIPNFNVETFEKVDEIVKDTREYRIYYLDEVARKYNKESRTDKDFYAWLNQSRKRKRIVLMITQEWRELPMWLRRPAKFMYTTKRIPLLSDFFNIWLVTVGDAENLVYDKDTNEYLTPVIKYIIYRRTKKIADMYDTFEAVNDL